MSNEEQQFLFFLKCPNIENLLSFSVEVFSDNQRKGLKIFHQRILKCRELVFSEPNLVAAPSNFSITEIIIVMPKNRFYSAEFQTKLHKLALKVLKIDDALPTHLQDCLQYTAIAKLAPQWNNVKDLLVQGRDFLMSSSPLRAIKLDISVNGNEIVLCVVPKCIKLPHFKVETYKKLYEYSEKVISIHESCHVLPSLKMGKAVSLSKAILPTEIFKNYSELKKHWKNMYGYRLPEIPEDDVWYLTVAFNVPFSPAYTYPSFCVRPFSMTEVPRVDPQPTLHSFIKDFCKKVGNICQEKCQLLDHKASFPLLHLYSAQDAIKDIVPRPGTTYTTVKRVPYRSFADCGINNNKLMNAEQEPETHSMNIPSQKTEDSLLPDLGNELQNSMNRFLSNRNNTADAKSMNSPTVQKSSLYEVTVLNKLKHASPKTGVTSAGKYAPTFMSKVKRQFEVKDVFQVTSQETEKSKTKYTPRFFSKKENQTVQSSRIPDFFPKTKPTKSTKKISIDKGNSNSKQLDQFLEENNNRGMDFKNNSDQFKDVTVMNRGKVLEINCKRTSIPEYLHTDGIKKKRSRK